MYFMPTYEHYVRIKIKCDNTISDRTCDGTHEFEYSITDLSPRVDTKCSKCGSTKLVKLSSIDDNLIISREPYSIEI